MIYNKSMKIVHVGKNCEYKTINSCLKILNKKTLIILDDEIYNEKVVIDKPNVTIDGQNKAKIIYNDYAKKIHEDGTEYITFRTYTCLVKAKNVTLKNLTIENNAGDGKVVGQAVALHLYNTNIKVINCHLIGAQDTLFLGPLSDDLIERYIPILPENERKYKKTFKHYFENCVIEGTVDFIFGGSNCKFKKCTVISKASDTYIVAPNNKYNVKKGIVFDDCNITYIDGVKDNSVYLARPWRDYGFVTFKNCYLDKHVHEEGFSKWSDTNRHEHARFYEKNSRGPGANNDKRIKWAHIK